MTNSVFLYRGFDLDAQEIADALWLASHLTVAERSPEAEGTPSQQHSEPRTGDSRGISTESSPSQRTPEQQREPVEPTTDLYRAPEQRRGQSAEGLPFYAPAGEALRHKLDIARALRPLLQRVPSRDRVVLDEAATAEQMAQGNELALATTPEKERWLDLLLIIDESPSMVVWHRLIQELHTLLTQLGAFRSIESWGIGYQADEPFLHVTAGGGRFDAGRRAHYKELTSSTQRRLLLVVSDTSSAAWFGYEMSKWFDYWGRHNLLSLLHVFPQPFWAGTGLHQSVELVVYSDRPNGTNRDLAIDRTELRWRKRLPPASPPVPVATLAPHDLSIWAQTLINRGQNRLYAFSFEQGWQRQTAGPSAEPALEPTADYERLLHYQQRMSPLANELTAYLAAVPLSLPIIRLVQQAMLPESTQLHLAELFHSGAVRRTTERYDSTIDPDLLQYDFVDDGLRDLFLRSVDDSSKERVLRMVSEHIDQYSGLSYSFRALLFDPTFSERMELDERGEPFARIATRVLRSMGSRYADLAERIEKGLRDGIIDFSDRTAAEIARQEQLAWKRLQQTASQLTSRLQPVTSNDEKLTVVGKHLAQELRRALWPLRLSPLTTPAADVALPHVVEDGTTLNLAWCWVPGGAFTMGGEQYDDEQPIHQREVAGFWMMRDPVTNAQYRQFVEDGGYAQAQWWSADGWREREEEEWTVLRYWDDERFNGDDQPVVGVSWYEAEAFCRWASAATGLSLRLPTEPEWEKAARGTDGREYPWGDEAPTPERCNYNKSDTGQTTPVGTYSPDGDSPYGCTDMAGNVFDWTNDWFKPYDGNTIDNSSYGETYRVVRGGSWDGDDYYVRAASRINNDPTLRGYFVGFRCANTPF